MDVSESRWLRPLKGFGLRSKFILIIVSMILGIVCILTLYSVSVQRSMLRNELRNRAVSLSKSFAHNCAYPVLLEDIPVVRQMTAGILSEEDVAFVQVRRADGSVLLDVAKGAETESGERHSLEVPPPGGDASIPGVLEQGGYLTISIPIDKPTEEDVSPLETPRGPKGSRRLGEAIIGFSLERTRELTISSITSTLLITVAIGIAGTLMALALVQYLMKPLLSLMDGTREIASGNLAHRVEIRREDELGRLAGSFNEMAAKLEDNRKSLDEYSRDLETMVLDRTVELSLREEELSHILENNPAGILLVDVKTDRISWANSNALRMLRGTKEQIEGRPFHEYVSQRGHADWDAAETGEAGDALERCLLTADGVEMPVLASVSRIHHEGAEHLLNAFFDITERKKLEAQLLQAQKLGAIGTLAGGIAHDFNNLLQGISGFVELVLLEGLANEAGTYYLGHVQKSVQRGAELVRQLLTFGRKLESQLRPLDLNREVEKCLSLLQRTLPKMISIEMDFCAGLNKISADSTQLEQMIVNLALNARDAMPHGGKLLFKTANVTLGEDQCKTIVELTPGEYVLLSVTDTGMGMDRSTLEHVFEPFYTTKEVGEGTGLGLAMVYGIVKSHRGHITCHSREGRGTTFEIFLPVFGGEAPPAAARVGQEAKITGGNETILLVDDEDAIRTAGRQMLSPHGYKVVTAESGEAAIEIVRTEGGDIQLIILDLGMPGMGGHRCLQEVLKIRPDAKIMIASGYNDSDKRKELLEAGARAFLGKPYRYNDLLRMVRDLLDDRSGPMCRGE